jgi:hypothetical protein
VLSQSRLLNQGITDEITQQNEIICEDYTDEEINQDFNAVDFDSAQAEVERMEEEKRKAQLIIIQEEERKKAREEFEKLQQEEQVRSETMKNTLMQK